MCWREQLVLRDNYGSVLSSLWILQMCSFHTRYFEIKFMIVRSNSTKQAQYGKIENVLFMESISLCYTHIYICNAYVYKNIYLYMQFMCVYIYLCNACVYEIDVVCNEWRVVYVWNACVYSYVCMECMRSIQTCMYMYCFLCLFCCV